MRERSIGVVLRHEGKASDADEMAESMSWGEEVWIVQVGLAVEGSIDWKVPEDLEAGCGRPEWKVCLSGKVAMLLNER